MITSHRYCTGTVSSGKFPPFITCLRRARSLSINDSSRRRRLSAYRRGIAPEIWERRCRIRAGHVLATPRTLTAAIFTSRRRAFLLETTGLGDIKCAGQPARQGVTKAQRTTLNDVPPPPTRRRPLLVALEHDRSRITSPFARAALRQRPMPFRRSVAARSWPCHCAAATGRRTTLDPRRNRSSAHPRDDREADDVRYAPHAFEPDGPCSRHRSCA